MILSCDTQLEEQRLVVWLKCFYAWMLPPAIFVVILVGLAWRMRRKSGYYSGMALFIAAMLYLCSIQVVADGLLRPLEYHYSLPQEVQADAIVLLGGGTMAGAPVPQGWSGQASDASMQRVVAALWLHRQTGLPILISGGEVFRGNGSEALVMQNILLSLGVDRQKIFCETESLNTRQNAMYSRKILERQQWRRIVLVTSAFHMQRAVGEFAKTELTVLPYPTGYYVSTQLHRSVLDWTPSHAAMSGTGLALKEYLGLAALAINR